MRTVVLMFLVLLAAAARAEEFTRKSAIASAESCAQQHRNCNEDAAAFLIESYEAGDRALLPIVIRVSRVADGAMSELTCEFVPDQLVGRAKPFMRELAKLSPNLQRSAAERAFCGQYGLDRLREMRAHVSAVADPKLKRIRASLLRAIDAQITLEERPQE